MKTRGRRKSDNIIDITPKDGIGQYAQTMAENERAYRAQASQEYRTGKSTDLWEKNQAAREKKASTKTSRVGKSSHIPTTQKDTKFK